MWSGSKGLRPKQRSGGEHGLQDVASTVCDVGEQPRSLVQWQDIADEVGTNGRPLDAQKGDRLRGEAVAVPVPVGPAGHAADLGGPQPQPVVVEFFREPQFTHVAATGVEGEVDDRALRPAQPQREGESGDLAATLQYDVGATVAGPVPPA